jgi:hypothetical protein
VMRGWRFTFNFAILLITFNFLEVPSRQKIVRNEKKVNISGGGWRDVVASG